MRASRTAARLALAGPALAALLAASVALANSASASGPYPQTPVVTDVLDAIAPQPDELSDGYYSEQERVYGILGMSQASGPYGDFSQPANRDEPMYKGMPGWGVQGMASELTGITPRPPGGDDADGDPARAYVGPVLLPFCDSPEPCTKIFPLVDDRKPQSTDAEEVLAQRAAGAGRALSEIDWWTGLELRKTLDPTAPSDKVQLAADDEAIDDLLAEATSVVDNNEFMNETLMPVGEVLEAVDPASAEERQGEDETLSASAGPGKR
jgi:hypothetical protein